MMCFATTVVQRLMAAAVYLCVYLGSRADSAWMRSAYLAFLGCCRQSRENYWRSVSFMLKLASDNEDEEVVRNVLFVFEQLHGREH